MVEVNFSEPSAAIYLFTLLLNWLQIIIHKIKPSLLDDDDAAAAETVCEMKLPNKATGEVEATPTGLLLPYMIPCALSHINRLTHQVLSGGK